VIYAVRQKCKFQTCVVTGMWVTLISLLELSERRLLKAQSSGPRLAVFWGDSSTTCDVGTGTGTRMICLLPHSPKVKSGPRYQPSYIWIKVALSTKSKLVCVMVQLHWFWQYIGMSGQIHIYSGWNSPGYPFIMLRWCHSLSGRDGGNKILCPCWVPSS
jgi:hypothetical protein